jgi:hypothetical protein
MSKKVPIRVVVDLSQFFAGRARAHRDAAAFAKRLREKQEKALRITGGAA